MRRRSDALPDHVVWSAKMSRTRAATGLGLAPQ
jgi:hypothetical protein